ncbi:putative lysine methyltransferase [Helianthus debilis subsp. tardiflorus]
MNRGSVSEVWCSTKDSKMIYSGGLRWSINLRDKESVLHKMYTSSEFNGSVAVELGAGTGLVGMLLARIAKPVFLSGQKG